MPKSLDKPFKWTAVMEQCLLLVFAGRWTQEEVAKKCGISARTVWGWTQHPEFQTRLETLRADFAESIKGVAYADKARRIWALNSAAEIALRELEARPLLKEIRPTRDGEIVNEAFNNAAMAEFRGALDDIAKEMGHRKPAKDDAPAVPANVQVVFMVPEQESSQAMGMIARSVVEAVALPPVADEDE